jgi:translation elongation factor P/translation initiation factor 5A
MSPMQYAKGDGQVFMDIETFDEFEFSNEQLGDFCSFLIIYQPSKQIACHR